MFSMDATISSGLLKLFATLTPALRGAPAVTAGTLVGWAAFTTAQLRRGGLRKLPAQAAATELH
jgi:hypothetical protein